MKHINKNTMSDTLNFLGSQDNEKISEINQAGKEIIAEYDELFRGQEISRANFLAKIKSISKEHKNRKIYTNQ